MKLVTNWFLFITIRYRLEQKLTQLDQFVFLLCVISYNNHRSIISFTFYGPFLLLSIEY